MDTHISHNTNNKKIIIYIVIISGIIVAIASGAFKLRGPRQQTTDDPVFQQQSAAFGTLTSGELAAVLEKKDFFFVNVHIPYEGEIKNTDVFIPYDKIGKNLDKLPVNKNTKIVLYCRSGRMSEVAAQTLVKLGYTRVSHLEGGLIDWEKNGYEILLK